MQLLSWKITDGVMFCTTPCVKGKCNQNYRTQFRYELSSILFHIICHNTMMYWIGE